MTTMGVYVRDLLLGQYYFDTLFPRIPVPVIRQITANLEKMKLPTKPSGSTGESTRHGGEDMARRPPSVKAALSVSFGQRAPHRASTRDSSPVRRSQPPPSRERRRSPSPRERRRSRSRDRQDRKDRHRSRSSSRDRRDRRDRSSSRDIRDRRRSRSSSRSRYSGGASATERRHSPFQEKSKAAAAPPVNSNLAKLKDLYGDGSEKGEERTGARYAARDSGTEEVIRLGGSSWK